MSTTVRDEPTSLRERVTDFLTYEADLADRHLYREWLSLWSTDATYWVPCNADDYDPRQHVSIIYDDHARLEERCYRLSTDGMHAQDPPSRLCRVIGNVQVSATGVDEIAVRANMVLVEVRSGDKTVYGARLEYRLVEDGDSLRIRQKKVVLLDNDGPLGNLTFLL
jgi:3-phenylpropionate/cinnamic acid dioxygenase small subunit